MHILSRKLVLSYLQGFVNVLFNFDFLMALYIVDVLMVGCFSSQTLYL